MPPHPVPRAFDVAYGGTPSWETGRPQPAVLRLLDQGAIGRRVLDAGCGTGLHAALLAERGHVVTGVDVAAAAVARAQARGWDGPGTATFILADILDPAGAAGLRDLEVDTVLDVGLFHVLHPDDRATYARSLALAARVGGTGFIVAWSDRNAFGRGPGRIRRRDLRRAFTASTGWKVLDVEGAELETRLEPGRVHAWLARLQRVAPKG